MTTAPWQLAMHLQDTATVTSAAATDEEGMVATVDPGPDPDPATVLAAQRAGRGTDPRAILLIAARREPAAAVAGYLAGLVPEAQVRALTEDEARAAYRERTGNDGPAAGVPITSFAGGDRMDDSRVPALGALILGPSRPVPWPAPAAEPRQPAPAEPAAPAGGGGYRGPGDWARAPHPGGILPELPRWAAPAATVVVLLLVVALLRSCFPGEEKPVPEETKEPQQTSQQEQPCGDGGDDPIRNCAPKNGRNTGGQEGRPGASLSGPEPE